MSDPSPAQPTLTALSIVWAAIAGGALTIVGGWLSNKWAIDREKKARADNRRDQIIAKHLEFQHETLISLQNSASRLSRASGKAHHQDLMAYKVGKTWGENLINDDDAEDLRQAMVEVMLLSSREKDQTIRELFEKLRDCSLEASVSRSPDAAREAMSNMSEFLIKLIDRIGHVLREIDAAEDGN